MAGWTTQGMMRDVLIALAPAILWSIAVFRQHALFQIVVTVAAALAAEWGFAKLRGQQPQLWDLSAVVTGVILALTLPWQAPFYIGVIAAFMAIGLGKAAFGGLGFNIFNPAMVGRAFVMLSFAKEMGAGGYVNAQSTLDAVTSATPLTVVKEMAKAVINGDAAAFQATFDQATSFTSLFWGYSNGSLGETSALAVLLGGVYLCARRSASWEIPAGVIGATALLGGLAYALGFTPLNPVDQILGGALLFGAFFIATDPVTSPLTAKGKLTFGIGVGAFIVLIRVFSGYPEGVMFAVLLMNAMVPLINRWTVPTPMGGPVPVRK
ncbi:RnfABCDGE type electron transport complex subunit D [Myxococcota bacterium]|nr:RnfABCDGE type electron transport complex subunit D [Myxococcota bacterium]